MNDEFNFEKEEQKKPTRRDRKNSKRFSIIDLLIIVVVIAMITLVVSAYMGGLDISFSSKKVNITYVIEIEGIEPSLASNIAVGAPVIDENGYSLGSVAAGIEVENYFDVSYDPTTGEVVSVPHPALSNLLITISAEAEIDEVKGYLVDGQRIAVGADYFIDIPGFEGKGECISVVADNAVKGGGVNG
jgi:hypothetical protein